MSIQQVKNWEIKLHFSRELRARKKMQLGESKEGDPRTDDMCIGWFMVIPKSVLDCLIFSLARARAGRRGLCRNHFLGKKARKIPEECVHTTNALQWRAGKGKQGAMSCPVAVVQLRRRIRLPDKKARASALLWGNWSFCVFASRFDDCQTRNFF